MQKVYVTVIKDDQKREAKNIIFPQSSRLYYKTHKYHKQIRTKVLFTFNLTPKMFKEREVCFIFHQGVPLNPRLNKRRFSYCHMFNIVTKRHPFFPLTQRKERFVPKLRLPNFLPGLSEVQGHLDVIRPRNLYPLRQEDSCG